MVKVNNGKLNSVLANQCKTTTDLRNTSSPSIITRIRNGQDVTPKTVGKLAKALEIDPKDLIGEE